MRHSISFLLTFLCAATFNFADVENVRIEDECVLCWDCDEEIDATYFVFGTDSTDDQWDNATDLIASSNTHFIGQTNDNHFDVNQQFDTYHVVKDINGLLSKPVSISKNLNSLHKRSNKDKVVAPTPYVRNPYVSDEIWNMMAPYFLPANKPEKAILDKIFSKRRVLASLKEMEKADFILITNPKDKIIVARHPKLKGYLVKVYLDPMETYEWVWWKKRIDGVNVIQKSINKHGYQNIMKTPKKWVYPLPAEPSPASGNFRKNFILVVEAIDILDHDDNRKAYKKKMNPQLLNSLYTVIMENKLIDSVYCDNTPFCTDGRLAFIDTEHAQDCTRPVPIWTLAQYLSKPMYAYWEQLIQHGVQ